MLLLHEFHGRKFLLPDKLSGRERERQARRQHAALHADDGEQFEEVKAGAYWLLHRPCCPEQDPIVPRNLWLSSFAA